MAAFTDARRALGRARRDAQRAIRRAALVLPTQIWGTITHVATREPLLALTFDDGPHRTNTPALLKILEEHDARATFFVLGERVREYPELLKRMVAAGHAVGNHSWDHPSFPSISSASRRRQIRACETEIRAYSQRLFRPPYGYQTFASRFDAWRLGMKVITWNAVGIDWRSDDAELIYSRLAKDLKSGSILLLHDALHDAEDPTYVARDHTLDAVRMLLKRHSGDYRFVTVPELLKAGRAQKSWWDQPGDPAHLARLQRSVG